MKPVESVDTVLTDFFVAGWPYAKQSFRYKRGGSYQTENIKNWQNTIGWTAKEHYKGELLTCPVKVYLDFFVKRNDSDVDNISKCLLDGLQGVVFKNDRQVMELHATKQVSKLGLGVRVRICTAK